MKVLTNEGQVLDLPGAKIVQTTKPRTVIEINGITVSELSSKTTARAFLADLQDVPTNILDHAHGGGSCFVGHVGDRFIKLWQAKQYAVHDLERWGLCEYCKKSVGFRTEFTHNVVSTKHKLYDQKFCESCTKNLVKEIGAYNRAHRVVNDVEADYKRAESELKRVEAVRSYWNAQTPAEMIQACEKLREVQIEPWMLLPDRETYLMASRPFGPPFGPPHSFHRFRRDFRS
jgi:hypothetical protein